MRIFVLPLLFAASSVAAQDADYGNGVAFTLGVGAGSTPNYFGSENSSVGPSVSFSPESFQFGSLSFGRNGDDAGGFGIKGSFRYIGERTAADNPELAGNPDVAAALELGGGLSYSTDNAEVYAVGRYGVIGHEAFVGEIGGDWIMTPSSQTELRVGPRLFFGDDAYSNAYFGSAADGYTATGGMLSRGVEASIAYDITDNWGVVGAITYDELLNDAANSPIVQTTDQLGVSLIVTRKVSWSF